MYGFCFGGARSKEQGKRGRIGELLRRLFVFFVCLYPFSAFYDVQEASRDAMHGLVFSFFPFTIQHIGKDKWLEKNGTEREGRKSSASGSLLSRCFCARVIIETKQIVLTVAARG